MKLDFRIDWGYQYLYSRRHYHPVYIWDGSLEAENGEILNTYKLDYPVIWFGPGHCAKETYLPSPEWKSVTKRGVSGVRIEAEVNDDTIFHLKTASANISFKAKDILENGRLDFAVGPKYLNCSVIITKTDYLWFRQPLLPEEVEFEADRLNLPVHNWARMKLAWLKPGESAKWEYEVKEKSKDYMETLVHIVAMAAPEYSEEKETQVVGYMPFEILCDGEKICEYQRYYRHHDVHMQILEDDWKRISVPSGRHTFELKNNHPEFCLAISRITMKPCEYVHGQLSIPEWALACEEVTGKVFAAYEDTICIKGLSENVKCSFGWNEFKIKINKAGITEFSTDKHKAEIEIFECEEEKYPVKVGYDMTTVPHDDCGFMDWLLDYTSRTRLGNYIVFRNFNSPTEDREMERWGKFCKEHNIYASNSTVEYNNEVFKKAIGEMYNDCGMHEYSFGVYALDPEKPYASEDMKEASEKFTEYLEKEIDNIHKGSLNAAFGDGSGGIRYSFLAGADFVRAETMVAHTMTLLSQARPAAEALGKGRWGVHIAIQHCHQPYHETHLGKYFLSLMQPWIMGAEAIYEEDSLFNLFKEERQAWDDFLTKGKRDMTRSFFKFAKTHPRKGKNVRNIAFLEGRYAAPFNGFICGSEQDPHYSVWGRFGNNKAEWGHSQPEKCRQLLDVLMPGASTHPLRQKVDERRFYFSGTPYGDFDCAPVEASGDYLNNYKLILNLGWNTAIEEDYEKLIDYVENGGVLLTGLPQFSTHIKRDFLKDMKDLAIYNDGDLSGLCGIKVNGAGEEYCGQWNCMGREQISEPELSAMPSDCFEEDGKGLLADIELCGAEIVAWDSASGKPMLVKNKVGSGYVYTFTLWAYPGHEKFQKFAAAWVEVLSNKAMPEVYVKDSSKEVFWTIWEDGDEKIIMLLNTDWTEKDNVKNVELVTENEAFPIEVKERTLVKAMVKDGKVSVFEYSL